MIDVKSGANYNSGFPVLGNPSVFICPPPRPDPYASQDLYNPVYEELSNGESCIAVLKLCVCPAPHGTVVLKELSGMELQGKLNCIPWPENLHCLLFIERCTVSV
jgi:hypothetical protein